MHFFLFFFSEKKISENIKYAYSLNLAFFSLFIQTANDRSAFSDYKTISTMNWDDKNKVAQCSKIVVTVSNWHFNRDHLKDEKAPVCELKNIMITLKLSSTIFETNGAPPAAAAESIPEVPEKSNSDSPLAASPGTAAANAGGTVTSRTGEHYFFDRNGAIIPYSAFLALIDSEDFQNYLAKVKDVYTQSCRCFDTPPKVNAVPEANKDDNDDDDDDEVSFIDEKKNKSKASK